MELRKHGSRNALEGRSGEPQVGQGGQDSLCGNCLVSLGAGRSQTTDSKLESFKTYQDHFDHSEIKSAWRQGIVRKSVALM